MRNTITFALTSLLLTACAQLQQPAGPSPDVCNAFRSHASHVEVTANGRVAKVLGVRKGPSGVHEGFLVALDPASGCRLTIRVEHNVDLAGRIPLGPGEAVELRGEYIYDPRGGIVHWTHRDPRGRHPGGYVRANGELYS